MAGRGKKKISINFEREWLVGIYTRRSFDDNEDFESNTIINQKSLINNYISKEDNMKIIDYYVDDGYTGTDFNRPAFQEMMNDIKEKRINTIIVKDLSRLGRNHLEVGRYIEDIFPTYNIRIIAINDNVDSFKRPESIQDLIIPIKNLINESYARDISKKVSSAYRTMASEGKYVAGTSPYGYTLDKEDKHHLVIDEEESKIVKEIFNMALNGEGRIKIVKYLNDNNIYCRKELQRRKKYKLSLDPIEEKTKYRWSTSTIGRMLTNEVYIGNLTQLRTKRESFKNHKVINVDKEDWVRFENTHEPIITKKDFDKVQKKIKINSKYKIRDKDRKYSIYNGLLKCGDCGKAMYKQEDLRSNRQLSNYFCSTYLYLSKSSCTSHKIKTEDLNNKKLQIYEDWKFEVIDKKEYIIQTKMLEDEINKLEENIEIYSKTYRENIRRIKKNDLWIDHYKRNRKIKKLTRDVLLELIDTIYITEDGNVDIIFKYRNEYNELLLYLEEGVEKECQNGKLVYI